MSSLKLLLPILIAYVAYKVYTNFTTPPEPIPKIDETWWGPGSASNQNKSIRPFKVNVSDEVLKDLKQRLKNARPFVPPLEGIAHEYGTNTDFLRDIVDHWANKYDWREREKRINKYPQFVTNIQGLDIHYYHVKPTSASGVPIRPILLLHGWPGSVLEFLDVMPILAKGDGKIAFEVYVASLPGFGFSSAAIRPGLGAIQMGVVFKNFMERMGHDKYYVQGGDFGMIVLKPMAVMYPDKVLGFHSNMCVSFTLKSLLRTVIGSLYPSWYVPEEHYSRVYPLSQSFADKLYETGYLHLQASKPDTVSVGLNDSPVGLAAYMLEKFVTGTDKDGRFQKDGLLKKYYSYDAVLDHVMWYWVTGSMPTAVRLYAETFNKAHFALKIAQQPVQVPVVCARFKNDFYSLTADIQDAFPKLLRLTDYDEGHFAAFQVPQKFAKEVMSGIALIEDYLKTA